jgi:hypothetical protein
MSTAQRIPSPAPPHQACGHPSCLQGIPVRKDESHMQLAALGGLRKSGRPSYLYTRRLSTHFTTSSPSLCILPPLPRPPLPPTRPGSPLSHSHSCRRTLSSRSCDPSTHFQPLFLNLSPIFSHWWLPLAFEPLSTSNTQIYTRYKPTRIMYVHGHLTLVLPANLLVIASAPVVLERLFRLNTAVLTFVARAALARPTKPRRAVSLKRGTWGPHRDLTL